MKILKTVPVEIETSGADDHQCSVHCQFCDGEVCSRYKTVVMGFRGDMYVAMDRCSECMREFGVSAESESCSE
jgi:hypothetical protein